MSVNDFTIKAALRLACAAKPSLLMNSASRFGEISSKAKKILLECCAGAARGATEPSHSCAQQERRVVAQPGSWGALAPSPLPEGCRRCSEQFPSNSAAAGLKGLLVKAR